MRFIPFCYRLKLKILLFRNKIMISCSCINCSCTTYSDSTISSSQFRPITISAFPQKSCLASIGQGFDLGYFRIKLLIKLFQLFSQRSRWLFLLSFNHISELKVDIIFHFEVTGFVRKAFRIARFTAPLTRNLVYLHFLYDITCWDRN